MTGTVATTHDSTAESGTHLFTDAGPDGYDERATEQLTARVPGFLAG